MGTSRDVGNSGFQFPAASGFQFPWPSTTGNETVLSSALRQIPPSASTGFGFHFASSTTNMVNGVNPPVDNNNEPQEDLMVNDVRNVNEESNNEEVQASEVPRERKFQKNDAVEINEKVVGPKRVYIGQPGTVYGLNGSWIYVKLAGKTDPVPFRPKWLD
jgi:hypothetical protein